MSCKFCHNRRSNVPCLAWQCVSLPVISLVVPSIFFDRKLVGFFTFSDNLESVKRLEG